MSEYFCPLYIFSNLHVCVKLLLLYHIDFYYVKLFWLERQDYIGIVLDESKKMYYSLDAVERKKNDCTFMG